MKDLFAYCVLSIVLVTGYLILSWMKKKAIDVASSFSSKLDDRKNVKLEERTEPTPAEPLPSPHEEHQQLTTALTDSAVQGNPWAQWYLGMSFLGSSNNQEAFKWFSASADQGYPPAQCKMAAWYSTGEKNLPQDHERAAELFQKASLQGYILATFRFADCVKTGQGTPKDESIAEEFYNRATQLAEERIRKTPELGMERCSIYGNRMGFSYPEIANKGFVSMMQAKGVRMRNLSLSERSVISKVAVLEEDFE